MEEGGFYVSELRLFGYKRVSNAPGTPEASRYPEIAYYAYYWALTDRPLVRPTDPEKEPAAGSFLAHSVETLVRDGIMHASERDIIRLGLDAAVAYMARYGRA